MNYCIYEAMKDKLLISSVSALIRSEGMLMFVLHSNLMVFHCVATKTYCFTCRYNWLMMFDSTEFDSRYASRAIFLCIRFLCRHHQSCKWCNMPSDNVSGWAQLFLIVPVVRQGSIVRTFGKSFETDKNTGHIVVS